MNSSAKSILRHTLCVLLCLIVSGIIYPTECMSAYPESEFTYKGIPLNPEDRTPSFILISKKEMKLTVYGQGLQELFSTTITCGREFGDKRTVKDDRTPEGMFSIASIESSVLWKHRNNLTGKYESGCYGDWFIRLNTPMSTHIGIHGTNKPEEMGMRTSEGCVRIENQYLETLVNMVYVGLPVIIIPSEKDIRENEI